MTNALFSDDTKYMIDALTSLGITIEASEYSNEITVFSKGLNFNYISNPVYVGNAGTALRFLTTFLTLGQGEFILTGNERMKNRPIKDLVDGLNSLGANILYVDKDGYPPIKIRAKGLSGGRVSMKGNISSQFFSSIMLSGCYANNNIHIDIDGDLVSKPYIDITKKVMNDFGSLSVSYDSSYKSITIEPQNYKPLNNYIIEGDASNASYFFGAVAICGGELTVNNITKNSVQGDLRFLSILEEMGCLVSYGDNSITVYRNANTKLKGVDVDMNDISDVAQTLAVIALFVKGKTIIRNVYNMRLKETDRITALCNELKKLGADITEMDDGIIIQPVDKYKPANISTYDDHRMAMAFSLAGLKVRGLVILDPNCVSKTFPHYFTHFNSLYKVNN